MKLFRIEFEDAVPVVVSADGFDTYDDGELRLWIWRGLFFKEGIASFVRGAWRRIYAVNMIEKEV